MFSGLFTDKAYVGKVSDAHKRKMKKLEEEAKKEEEQKKQQQEKKNKKRKRKEMEKSGKQKKSKKIEKKEEEEESSSDSSWSSTTSSISGPDMKRRKMETTKDIGVLRSEVEALLRGEFDLSDSEEDILDDEGDRSKIQERLKVDKSVHTLFVGGFDLSVTKEQIRELFEECGEVGKITIVDKNTTHRSTFVAFVNIVSKEGLNAALKMNGMTYMNKVLEIRKKAKNNNY